MKLLININLNINKYDNKVTAQKSNIPSLEPDNIEKTLITIKFKIMIEFNKYFFLYCINLFLLKRNRKGIIEIIKHKYILCKNEGAKK